MMRPSYQDKMWLETKWSEKWTWLISSPPRIALESPLWESGELTIIRRRHWANGSRPESRTQPSRITTLRATDIPVSTGAASPNRTGNRRFVASCDIHFTIAAGWGFWSWTRFIRVRVWDTAVISILNSTANFNILMFIYSCPLWPFPIRRKLNIFRYSSPLSSYFIFNINPTFHIRRN